MAAILICINVLTSYFHNGLDLTKEKRFTLSASTVKLLKNMQEVASIEVYLKEDHFPADLQRLQEAVHIVGVKTPISRSVEQQQPGAQDERTGAQQYPHSGCMAGMPPEPNEGNQGRQDGRQRHG